MEAVTRRERPLYVQRLVLVLLQMAVAAGLAAGAYAVLCEREDAAFREQFRDAAAHILDSSAERLADRLAAAATLALYVTDSDAYNTAAFPNMTLPGFTQVSARDLVSGCVRPFR